LIIVHSHNPSIRSHRGTKSGFSRFLANESLRRTGLHLPLRQNPLLPHPAFESPVHEPPLKNV
jgi:hypothetical protein